MIVPKAFGIDSIFGEEILPTRAFDSVNYMKRYKNLRCMMIKLGVYEKLYIFRIEKIDVVLIQFGSLLKIEKSICFSKVCMKVLV